MPYKVGYAPRGGSQCSVCTNKSAKAIPAGDLQFGVFYMNDGQEQLTWRHLFCVNSTQMKNIAKVYPFGKGLVDYDTLIETDQVKIKNYFEQYTGPLNSFEDALKAQGRRYTFAEESEIQPAPSERAKSPVEGSEVEGPAWGVSEPRSPGSSYAAPPLSATPSVAPPRYNGRAVSSNQRPYRPSVDTSAAIVSNQEREDLSSLISQLSLVDLDIATARVEHAAAMHEQVEGLELQVIQAELKVAEAESKLAEARIRKEEAKRSVIALQLAEVRKEGK